MGLRWCWAFGQESSALLESDMGWDWGSTSTGQGQPVSSPVYTYPGSPTRYSWSQDDGGFNTFAIPNQVWVNRGWVAIAILNTSNLNFARLINVVGSSSNRNIYLQCNGGSAINLYVDNVFKEQFSVTIGDWNYIALQYDMSTATWEGRAWVNGAAATANYTDPRSPETGAGQIYFSGVSGGTRSSYYAQIAVYDDPADAGQTPYYCTRIAPDTDTSVVGTWTPTAADNHSSTNSDPFNPSSYTEEATPSSGDQVTTSVAALNTALGITAGTVVGCTNHTYSSGTNLQAFAAVRDSGGAYGVGDTVTPDTSDTTYAFATQTAGFTGTSTVNFKYEIV